MGVAESGTPLDLQVRVATPPHTTVTREGRGIVMVLPARVNP